MLEYIGVGIISFVCGALGATIALKIAFKTINIPEIIEEGAINLMDTVLTETEMQKRVYQIGLLVGSGIRQGVGIGKGSGKFGFDQILQKGLAMIFGKVLQGNQKEEQTTESPNFLGLPT